MKPLIIISFLVVISSCKQRNENVSYGPPDYDSLGLVLEKMLDEEQEIRRILADSIGFDSPAAGPFIKKMQKIDEYNRENIEIILGRYGWIPKSKIGEKASDAIFYIVQHSNEELLEKYFSQFKALADSGEANPRLCAMMEDRLLMWQGKKQIFGTQAADFRPDKKMAIWPIEDPGNVDARRKKIGFNQTVEEYAKSMDVMFDPDEELPPDNN